MKKQYSKPDILFESFALSTSIAGNCTKDVNTFSYGVCGVRHGRRIYFTEGIGGCTTEVIDGSEECNGLCYHVPIAANLLFMS